MRNVARKILVVDDSPLIRAVVEVGLPAPAWQVLSAESGAEGVAIAAEARPDAILLDVVMPGLDGPATLEQLRAASRTHDIPVVFLTAQAEADDRERLCGLGVSGVIAKPFDPDGLADLLSTTMGWDA